MKGLKRSCYCNDVEGVGNIVTVGGYVQKIRDMGTLIFIDLRDRTGIVQLAFDENEWYMRRHLAKNPNTPADVLAQLANRADFETKYSLAENPNTPADILAQLANDKDKDVRKASANNPNTPKDEPTFGILAYITT